MRISRRGAVGLIGSTIAAPHVLIHESAAAAVRLRRIGKPRELGKNLPGGKFKVSLSAFPNGSFIAAFLNFRSSLDTRAYVRYFDPAGDPLSKYIQMGSPRGLTDGLPAGSVVPVANEDGSAMIFFSALSNDSPATEDIFAQPMTADMQKSGRPKRINKKTEFIQREILAVRLQQSGASARAEAPLFLVVWLTQGLTLDSYDINGALVTRDGQRASNERRMTAQGKGMQAPRDLKALLTGGAALSHTTFLPNSNFWEAYIQPFDDQAAIDEAVIRIKRSEGWPWGSAGLCPDPIDPNALYAAWYDKGQQDGVANQYIGLYDSVDWKSVKIDQFGTDPLIANPIPPNLVILGNAAPDLRDAILTRIQYDEIHPYYRMTLEAFTLGTAKDLTHFIINDRARIWASEPGRRPTNDALIQLPGQPNNRCVAGGSETGDNPQGNRAFMQIIEQVM